MNPYLEDKTDWMKGWCNVNRLGFLILSVLSASGAAGRASAMTVKEVMAAENLPYGYSTVFKQAVKFEAAGYVAAGHMDGKARTFYITEKGKNALQENK